MKKDEIIQDIIHIILEAIVLLGVGLVLMKIFGIL